MSVDPVNPGDVLAGKYRVDRVLGAGGMGFVVQATHLRLAERVALKLMLPEVAQDAAIAGRFLREARLAARLKSEHVARVMDVGELPTGAPYIVMEYLDGTDLANLVARHGPLPIADVAEYVIQACDAVAEAHALGIVHRDLKPSNLFLTRRPDGGPLVKVLDFGISKALGESGFAITNTSSLLGSPYFMSPEQVRSAKDVDARSDVWSIGVILYKLLTARLPFEADTMGGIMYAIFHAEPAPLTAHRPDVPHALDVIVRRCLQRDRDARAQNVGEIAAALVAYAPARAQPIADRIVALATGRGMPSRGSPVPRTGSAHDVGLVTGAPHVTTSAAPKGRGGASLAAAGTGLLLAGGVVVLLALGGRHPMRNAARPPDPTPADATGPAPAPVAAAGWEAERSMAGAPDGEAGAPDGEEPSAAAPAPDAAIQPEADAGRPRQPVPRKPPKNPLDSRL